MILQQVARKVRNVLRGLIQRYGTADIKRRLWDTEFASGRWDCLENMAEDCLYPIVETYAKQGCILDLGCGPGATGNELSTDKYDFYTGVDISNVAIEKARVRTERNHRSLKNEYYCSDIYSYTPTRTYDVIVLGDSIYYIPEKKIGMMLRRYCEYLNMEGVFIARIRGAYPSIIAIIEREFSLIENQLLYDSEICVIVFRPLEQLSS